MNISHIQHRNKHIFLKWQIPPIIAHCNHFHLMGMTSSAYARHTSHWFHFNSSCALNVLDKKVASFVRFGMKKNSYFVFSKVIYHCSKTVTTTTIVKRSALHRSENVSLKSSANLWKTVVKHLLAVRDVKTVHLCSQ